MYDDILFTILAFFGVGPLQLCECGLPCFVLIYYSGYIVIGIILSVFLGIMWQGRSDGSVRSDGSESSGSESSDNSSTEEQEISEHQ